MRKWLGGDVILPVRDKDYILLNLFPFLRECLVGIYCSDLVT